MTAIIDWPANLVPLNVGIRNPRKTVGSTTSITEVAQVVPAIRPPFGLILEFDELTGDELLSWRAFLGALEGRTNVARIPLFDLWLAAGDAALGTGLTGHSDGSSFSDGAYYLTSDLEGVLVTGVAGQRNITADFGAYGQLLQAGQYFGLGDRPYLATGVSWADNVATIRTTPTLRQDYTAQALRLRPVMLGRLTSDDGGQTVLQSMRHARPQVEFVEAFDVALP